MLFYVCAYVLEKHLKENLIYSSHIWIVFHVLWCFWICLFLYLNFFLKKWRTSKVLHGWFILQLWKRSHTAMFSWLLYFPPSPHALVSYFSSIWRKTNSFKWFCPRITSHGNFHGWRRGLLLYLIYEMAEGFI